MRSLEVVKEQLMSDLPRLRAENENVVLKGTQHTIALVGRNLDMIYYRSKYVNAPLIIYFHGGGFLLGSCWMDNNMLSIVSEELGASIASVGYRRTPEYMWPDPIIDAYDAAKYLMRNYREFGFDINHVSLFGCSAGGNIAASLAIYSSQKKEYPFKYQILLYPYLDLFTDSKDKGEGNLNDDIMALFSSLYVKKCDAKISTVSPAYVSKEDARFLPETIMCLAGFDSLRAEGNKYGDILEEAGVLVHRCNIEGAPHGFFEHGLGDRFSNVLADELENTMLENGSLQEAAHKALNFIKLHYK